MKKVILLTALSLFTICKVNAQTATELIGKWKLVKWTKKGQEQTVPDSTFQVFSMPNKFVSISEGKEHKGKWKLSNDNKTLSIRPSLITVNFNIDYFDAKKRVITSEQLGTLEYEKVGRQ